MKMTDGKKLVEVTMKIWNGSGYGPDWANEFFETAGLEFDGEVDAFMVDDVDYCIEQMEDWKNCRTYCVSHPSQWRMEPGRLPPPV